MKIGIYTPIHKINTEQLDFLVESLRNQTYKNFSWIVIMNGISKTDGNLIKNRYPDIDVRPIVSTVTGNIGHLKHHAVRWVQQGYDNDIALELDYDDALHPTCLEEIIKAAENKPKAQFFYSNFAHFDKNEAEYSAYYGEVYGWKRRIHKSPLFKIELNEMIAFPPKPQYLQRIESAPNHLRAFRIEAYNKIGGYNKELEVGDDHDLMCRFFIEYGEEGFCHINKCLYYQRYDGESTTFSRNKQIQEQVDLNYQKHSENMFLKWTRDNDLLALDFGGRFNCPEGYKSVDLLDADYIMDLNQKWNIADNCVGVLRAYHLLEHLDDPIHFFNEAYRVLVPGGILLIEVPSMRHPMAFADPTHKSFWTELNFEYYTNEDKARFIRPQYKGYFQKRRIVEYAWPDTTLVISAQLLCFKGEYKSHYWGIPPIKS